MQDELKHPMTDPTHPHNSQLHVSAACMRTDGVRLPHFPPYRLCSIIISGCLLPAMAEGEALVVFVCPQLNAQKPTAAKPL